MTLTNVIVFGPTGRVGSAATRAAAQLGAKVFLAMRDPEKPIPHLDLDQEQAAGFERVQADLTKPDTIHAAVIKTKATHAFIYLAFGSKDNMRSSIEALKSAGINFVVFLSSEGIQGDLKTILHDDFIAYAHAQVEINLGEVFGPNGFVAVRPGYFNSNSMQWKTMIKSGEVKILYPDANFDWISPEDIGRVCGTITAGGFQAAHERNVIRLLGPDVKSQREAVKIIGSVLNKDIRILEIDEKTGLDIFLKSAGHPEPIAKHLIKIMRQQMEATKSGEVYVGQEYKEAIGNVSKYGGGKPQSFEEWVAGNKQDFDV